MKHGRIRLETTGAIAVMTLNDPSVLNAFGQKLREDMMRQLDTITIDELCQRARAKGIGAPLKATAA